MFIAKYVKPCLVSQWVSELVSSLVNRTRARGDGGLDSHRAQQQQEVLYKYGDRHHLPQRTHISLIIVTWFNGKDRDVNGIIQGKVHAGMFFNVGIQRN
jgi:hypothetical protein